MAIMNMELFGLILEPSAKKSAKCANVLFLGDSRMQYAFSSEHVKSWFSSISATYYLFGFMYSENSIFTRALLNKLTPRAKVYVINLDTREGEPEDAFFETR